MNVSGGTTGNGRVSGASYKVILGDESGVAKESNGGNDFESARKIVKATCEVASMVFRSLATTSRPAESLANRSHHLLSESFERFRGRQGGPRISGLGNLL